jgi:hypothetical protein
MPPDSSSPQSPSTAPRERWRFSLGSVMIGMTLLSIVLALVRAIPLPEAFRQALLVLACVWGLIALVAVGPAWLRFVRLRRDVRHRQAELRQWAEQQRRTLEQRQPPDP